MRSLALTALPVLLALPACHEPAIDGPAGDGGAADDTGGDCVPTADAEDCETPEDDDCSGTTNDEDAYGCEDYYVDADGDGFGLEGSSPRCLCEPEGDYTSKYPSDCNDEAAEAYLGAQEVCDGLDNDCDGEVDGSGAEDSSLWYLDADGDGYGGYDAVRDCEAPEGYVAESGDCDDENPYVNPGEPEHCDGIDNDCSSSTDEEDVATAFADASMTDPIASSADLATALASVPDGGVLAVCPGSYRGELSVEGDVTVVGVDGAEATELVGTGAKPVVRVLSGAVTLSGLTITGGSGMIGGGVDASRHDGSLVVEDCAITGNAATDGAGLALASTGGWSLAGVTVSDNVASGQGGGILAASDGALEDVSVTGNSAESGGGIAVTEGANLAATDLAVSDNAATAGGGLWFDGAGTASLAGGAVTGNLATEGGGAYLGEGAAVLSADSTDWGAGSTDNDPEDVYFDFDATYDFGTSATFTCDASIAACD